MAATEFRALTIAQPWAELIARRRKHYETRSWPTNFRGRLAIHAARQGSSGVNAARMRELAQEWKFRADDLTTSAIVAICTIADVVEVDAAFLRTLDDEERRYGDYTLGRFAWRLTSVKRIDPIPCRGALGVWKPTTDIAAKLDSQT